MANMQRLWPLQNHHFGSKIKIPKKVRKTTFQPGYSCSMQKAAPRKNEYWKNEAVFRIDKNGQYEKAKGFAKSPLWVKN